VSSALPVLSGLSCAAALSCPSRNHACPFTSERSSTNLSTRSISSSTPRGFLPAASAATRRAVSSARLARSSTAAFTCTARGTGGGAQREFTV
jgi:hypothetical protein